MRIIHLIESYAKVGGAEAYAGQIISHLQRMGHQNSIVFAKEHPTELRFQVGKSYHVPQPKYPQPAAIAMQRIREIITLERPDAAFVHHVYHPAVVRFVAGLLPAIAYVQGVYLVCPGALQYLPRSERLCPHTAGLICLWNARFERCMPGRNPIRHVFRLQRVTALLAAYDLVRTIVVGSEFMRELLHRNGISNEKMLISPTYLLETLPEPGPPSAAEPRVPTVFFGGRLVREKGLHHVILALKELSIPWRLVVAGTGPDEEYCRELVGRHGLTGRVTFCGWLDDAMLERALSASDLVAVTSLLPEAFGRMGPEAFAQGKPVVGYASGGICSWLQDGVNGLLVPTGDIPALQHALSRLLSDVSLRAELGRRAREHVRKTYSIDRHMPDIVAALERAAATGTGNA